MAASSSTGGAPRGASASRPDGIEIGRLKRRADFLRLAGGRKAHMAAFTLQAAHRPTAVMGPSVRVGFTVTKKIGNAVVRNRVRRRLKAAVAQVFPLYAVAGNDYVLVGRAPALTRPFAHIAADLAAALGSVHQSGRPARPRRET